MRTSGSADLPAALVERGAQAVGDVSWIDPDGDHARHIAAAVLAAVLPDLAEEKQRAIESALILAAAHDEDAARPVVDRDALAIALHDYECSDRCDPMVMGKFFRRAEHLLATLDVQDAADVRRAVAEEIVAAMEAEGGTQRAIRIAREVGERNG